jgi:CheY-like chemotaxis protein
MTGGNETIMLVEDDQMSREVTIKILKRLGYTVLDAPGGDEALPLAESFKSQVDLLLTDVIMPGLNGHQLANKLKILHPEMAILFISGYTDDILSDHGVYGATLNFLVKPYTPQSLAGKIREVLEKKKALN